MWVRRAVAASGTGNLNTTVNLLVGGTATYTVNATVSASASGTITNTATVSAPSGVTETNPTNNSATDMDSMIPTVDLSITKTDGVAQVQPNQVLTYTIIAANAGPSAVVSAPVVDTFPAELTNVTWTCAASVGSSCAIASGSGNLNTTVSLLAGGTATYTVNATVSGSASGTITNTATIAAPGGVTDTNPSNNSATDVDATNLVADLAITKTDGLTTVVPGTAITYTIVATNNGPSVANGATVADTFPAFLVNPTWTCVASVGSSCGTANGTGNINTTVNLFVGGTATYTVNATVSALASGALANTATVAAPAGVTDPNPNNNTATDVDTLNPTADLAITKTDGLTTVVPGTAITYTIVATNNGPSIANGATVADTFPAFSSIRRGRARRVWVRVAARQTALATSTQQ